MSQIRPHSLPLYSHFCIFKKLSSFKRYSCLFKTKDSIELLKGQVTSSHKNMKEKQNKEKNKNYFLTHFYQHEQMRMQYKIQRTYTGKVILILFQDFKGLQIQKAITLEAQPFFANIWNDNFALYSIYAKHTHIFHIMIVNSSFTKLPWNITITFVTGSRVAACEKATSVNGAGNGLEDMSAVNVRR